jgi:hypothetical protein
LGGAGIPNHLRDSIFRLVENQAIEAEEQERALAEARGEPSRGRRQYDDVDHDEEDHSRVRVVGEGDASGDEDVEGDSDKVVDVSPSYLTAFIRTEGGKELMTENEETGQRTSIRPRPSDQA